MYKCFRQYEVDKVKWRLCLGKYHVSGRFEYVVTVCFVIASPICCVTVIDGVGAVCEWPKNCRGRVVLEFQW